MKIIFHKVRYKNFLSSGNVFTEISLDSANLTLIIGKNGAGKSTVLDAISFALFNKPFRKITKPQIINSVTNKNCVVEIEFSTGADEWKIVRGIKPNVFEIHKNGTILNETNSDNYQDYLENHIIRIGHKAFCQVIVLGSASYVPFLELPGPQRREIIENLLDLEIFTTMNVLLKKKISVLDITLKETLSQKTLQEDRIALQKKNNEKLKQNNDLKIAEATEQFIRTRIDIESLPKLNSNIAPRQPLIDKLDEATTEINKNTRLLDKGEDRIKTLKKEIAFYNDSDNCPVCKQLIDEIFKKTTVEEKQKELAKYEKGCKILKDKIFTLKENYKLFTGELAAIDFETKANNKIETELQNLKWKQKEIEKRIEALKNEKFEDKSGDLTELLADLETINNQYDTLSKEKNNSEILLKMLKDDGIKARIVSQYIEIINTFINNYLQEMDFICQFSLDENFNEKIKSRYRDEFTFNSFSEGEKLRITLAILFTWREIAKRRNSINTNILFFDEVLDSSLDSDGIDSFIQIIKNLTSENNTFIISHNSENKTKIDNIIEFEKKKGFSQIAN